MESASNRRAVKKKKRQRGEAATEWNVSHGIEEKRNGAVKSEQCTFSRRFGSDGNQFFF